MPHGQHVLLLQVLCLVLATAYALHSLPTDPTYNAASVQYETIYLYPDQQELTTSVNIEEMTRLVKQAADEGADVVNFAEGATGYFEANLNKTRADMKLYCEVLPNVVNGIPVIIPCTDPSAGAQAKAFSCAASKNSVVVAVNLCDIQPCQPGASTPNGICPDDGMFLFDTTIVFSETGQVLGKYWKYNLFSGDFLFNRLPAPTHTIIDVPALGVKFGLFICFDLVYRDPAINLVEKYGVTDFLFSTAWINHNIFTATMVQQAFSLSNRVNLVASNNARCPGNCGGGVYHMGVPLDVYYSPTDAAPSVITHATVPKIVRSATTPPSPSSVASPVLGHQQSSSTGVLMADCGFGPNSCAIFNPNVTKSGTLAAVGASGLRCLATFMVDSVGASRTWALQALDENNTIASSPSSEEQTSCMFLPCTLRTDSRGHHYCHVIDTNSPSATSFSSVHIEASGLHPDSDIFPIMAMNALQVVGTNYTSYSRSGSTASFTLLSHPPDSTLFIMGLQVYRSPLTV